MSAVSLTNFMVFHRKENIKLSPASVYNKLYSNQAYSFIYESLESLRKRGRYSFVGSKPFLIFKGWRNAVEIDFKDKKYHLSGNPVDELKKIIKSYKTYPPVLPFSGGAVGYMAYDVVRQFEKIPDDNPDDLNMPELFFIFPEEIIVFDHKVRTVDVIVYSEKNDQERVEKLYEKIEECVEDVTPNLGKPSLKSLPFKSNFTEDSFGTIVERAKEYIRAGDIFQVVLSQRLIFRVDIDPMKIYHALRITNPSPYMYYLNFDGLNIIGSSPEILVKLIEKDVTIRPLAGTRPRGQTREDDEVLKAELLGDEKERAEHIMLVDLARNDIGQVCSFDTVRVTGLLEIERYSKVMHIVSNVVGKLREDRDAFHLLASTFPAGTVSGAPKIRAMEIIDELEPVRRGIYAGSIGYFGFSGDVDMCITIRTIVINKGFGYIQAGAGIVADSVPQKEYQETLNKAKALIHAIEMTRG